MPLRNTVTDVPYSFLLSSWVNTFYGRERGEEEYRTPNITCFSPFVSYIFIDAGVELHNSPDVPPICTRPPPLPLVTITACLNHDPPPKKRLFILQFVVSFSLSARLQPQVSARYCPSRPGDRSAAQTGTPASRTWFGGHGAPAWLSGRGHFWIVLLQFGPNFFLVSIKKEKKTISNHISPIL